MKYVFGPVPSRRLGKSLGIDTIPFKTCNWNCVYCQLGRSKPLTNERLCYFPEDEIIAEVDAAIKTDPREEIDWITFVGSGEPTLHAGIGDLIREVKNMTDIPVAVITNGALLFLQEVRQALLPADAVLPSLDAGTPELYKRLNRPHPGIPYEKFVAGEIQFGQEYQGRLWLEVMLVQGLNDTPEALEAIAMKIEKIQPDKVHIGLPTRPPAEDWVKPADADGLMRATAIFGAVADVIHPQEGNFDLSGGGNILDALIAIITRHPMSAEQLSRALEIFSKDRQEEIIHSLTAAPEVQVIERLGTQFWCAGTSFFPEIGHSSAG